MKAVVLVEMYPAAEKNKTKDIAGDRAPDHGITDRPLAWRARCSVCYPGCSDERQQGLHRDRVAAVHTWRLLRHDTSCPENFVIIGQLRVGTDERPQLENQSVNRLRSRWA